MYIILYIIYIIYYILFLLNLVLFKSQYHFEKYYFLKLVSKSNLECHDADWFSRIIQKT